MHLSTNALKTGLQLTTLAAGVASQKVSREHSLLYGVSGFVMVETGRGPESVS